MNKVDVMTASRHTRQERPAWHPDPAEVRHAPYRREPYVRVKWEGGTVDAKAMAWTRTHVLVHREGETVHDLWVPAGDVVRIPREESRWVDPYDLLR